jgi:hypothetical protein
VPDEVLTVSPAGLHLDEGRARTERPRDREGQTRLAGSADALQQVESAHREAAQEAADVTQLVEQHLVRVGRIDGDAVLEILAERLQVGDLVGHGRLGLEPAVAVHLAACREWAHAVGASNALVDILA